MSADWTNTNRLLDDIEHRIDAAADAIPLECWPDVVDCRFSELHLAVQALRAELMVLSVQSPDQSISDSEQYDPVVRVTVSGVERAFDRLSRHILYSIEEQKPISAKYTPAAVSTRLAVLVRDSLLTVVYENDPVYSLTPDGQSAVEQFRARHS